MQVHLVLVLLLFLGAHSETASKRNEVSWKMLRFFYAVQNARLDVIALLAVHKPKEISKGKAIKSVPTFQKGEFTL